MDDAPLTLAAYPRAIVHIDGDAFFASCEQSRDPQLRGKPVITGQERGIVASLSYEAKARGVNRGMLLFEVKRLCPDVILLPSDYETYSLLSKELSINKCSNFRQSPVKGRSRSSSPPGNPLETNGP